MINRVIETILVDWTKLKDLQPEGFKIETNLEALKKSLIKNGFAMPFYGWRKGKDIFTVDGHTRKKALNELISEGHDVPNQLSLTLIEAKDKKEAIKILVEVFNHKGNSINRNAAEEWFVDENMGDDVDWDGVDYRFSSNHISNNLNANDFDENEEFDPIGISKDYKRIVFIFNNEEAANSFMNQNKKYNEILKKQGASWIIDLTTQST